MSLIIKGEKMPKECGDCIFCLTRMKGNDRVPVCLIKGVTPIEAKCGRATFCPLIEVPTPHGRLIDADVFESRARAAYCDDCDRRKGVKNGKVRMVYGIGDVPCRACGTDDMLCDIEDCPTVIEAEADNE